MKKIILQITFCFAFFCSAVSANDGVFYASGNTLIPLQETEISLKKEVLKFYVRDFEFMDVEVVFEFYNPGKAKTLTVGFVSPPSEGDVDEETQNNPNITNFTVTINGKTVTYKVKKMKDTSFKFGNEDETGNDFVYYFPATFKKGLNKIRHTYRFRGGASVELQRDFDYQITTGRRWANRQIDDFELQIHLDNGIFFVPAKFTKTGREAKWQIVGDGVIDQKAIPWFSADDSPLVKMVHLNNGYLLLEEKKFKPENDILIGEYNWAAGWFERMCKRSKNCPVLEEVREMVGYFTLNPHTEIEITDFSMMTPEEIKIIRNFAYAARGYEFKDKSLFDFYSQFFWYKPDKNLKSENIKLSKAEEEFLTKLKNIEKIKKNK